jgi:hypothetical protein
VGDIEKCICFAQDQFFALYASFMTEDKA